MYYVCVFFTANIPETSSLIVCKWLHFDCLNLLDSYYMPEMKSHGPLWLRFSFLKQNLMTKTKDFQINLHLFAKFQNESAENSNKTLALAHIYRTEQNEKKKFMWLKWMATVSTNKKKREKEKKSLVYIKCIHITFHKLGTNYRQQQQ